MKTVFRIGFVIVLYGVAGITAAYAAAHTSKHIIGKLPGSIK